MTHHLWAEPAHESLDRALDQVQSFQARLAKDFDAVDVWWERAEQTGFEIGPDGLTELDPAPRDAVVVRAHRGDRVRETRLDSAEPDRWAKAVARTRPKAGRPPPRAVTARRPPPMTFDPSLEGLLSRRAHLRRLAEALRDNTLHEAERLRGLTTLQGGARYARGWTVIAGATSVVSRFSAHLNVRVELNGEFGDEVRQVHAPESLLPLALLGARTWRMMPRELVRPPQLRVSDRRAVLHPRAVEKLLRAALPATLAANPGWTHGARVASPTVSLIDDPGLDGMLTSRAFDDEGQATRRRALIIRGRFTDGLHEGGGAAPGTVTHDAQGTPTAALSSVLMERGSADFHELIDMAPTTILVQSLGPVQVDATGAFSAPIRWGQSLERGRFSRLLAPGKWRLQGRLFDGPDGPGCLSRADVSRELVDTGTGVLPYCVLPDVL